MYRHEDLTEEILCWIKILHKICFSINSNLSGSLTLDTLPINSTSSSVYFQQYSGGRSTQNLNYMCWETPSQVLWEHMFPSPGVIRSAWMMSMMRLVAIWGSRWSCFSCLLWYTIAYGKHWIFGNLLQKERLVLTVDLCHSLNLITHLSAKTTVSANLDDHHYHFIGS